MFSLDLRAPSPLFAFLSSSSVATQVSNRALVAPSSQIRPKKNASTSLVAVKRTERATGAEEEGFTLERRVRPLSSPSSGVGKQIKTHPSLTLLPQLSSASLITLSSCAGHLTSWLEWDAERVMRRLRVAGDAAPAFAAAAAAAVPLPLLGSSRLGS